MSVRYTVLIARSVAKQIAALPAVERQRVDRAILDLELDPRPHGAKKISGRTSGWRIRVGNHRVVYSVIDSELLVELIRVAHRRDVYRDL